MYTRILLLKREMENTLKKNFLYKYKKKRFYIGDNKYFSIVDDDYDYNTIVIELYDILKIRIDIGIKKIKITINELSLDYTVCYMFRDKLRFSSYKDKDQELINLCNEILVKGYIALLYKIFFIEEDIKVNISMSNNYMELVDDIIEQPIE